MTLPGLIGLAVVVIAIPLNWYVAFRLWRLSVARPDLLVLRERVLMAVALALLVTVFGLIFLNNDLIPPPLSFDDTKILTRGAMLIAGTVPSLYWLWIYR